MFFPQVFPTFFPCFFPIFLYMFFSRFSQAFNPTLFPVFSHVFQVFPPFFPHTKSRSPPPEHFAPTVAGTTRPWRRCGARGSGSPGPGPGNVIWKPWKLWKNHGKNWWFWICIWIWMDFGTLENYWNNGFSWIKIDGFSWTNWWISWDFDEEP